MTAPRMALKHGEITDRIIGCFYEAYNELGHGFLESVYREALTVALEAAGLRVQREAPIPVWFKGHIVGEYRADLLVDGLVIVEIKVARALEPSHEAQLIHYLKATRVEVGLLLNFGPRPYVKRVVFDNPLKKIRENPCESVVRV
jgi:GxxExxY protein